MSSDMFPDSFIKYALEKEAEEAMADHGENYTRDEKTPGVLGKDCGHHCGAITVGHAGSKIGHCDCPECHGPSMMVDPQITSLLNKPEGIDPGGIV